MSDEEKGEKKKFFESDAGDGTLREEQYLTGWPLYLCVASILTCMFLFGMDQTIVAPAVTVIANDFGAFDQVAWLSSAFFLPVVVLCVFWGKISIVLGRKYTMILGLVIFEAGSVVCATANSMSMLIGGRALAGIGGGAIQSLGFIIVNEVVPIDKRSLVLAAVGANFSVASVLGPVIGGAFVSEVSWRWCFYVNLPIGGVALVFFYLSFNPPKPRIDLKQSLLAIDYLGTLLLAAGLILFLLGLSFGSEIHYSWSSPMVISFLVLGVVISGVFFLYNFRFSKNPILDINVFLVPQIQSSGIGFGFMFAYYMSTLIYLSIYFQNVKGKDAIGTGISLFPYIIPLVLSTAITPILINHTRYIKPFSIFAGFCCVAGAGIVLILDVDSSSGQTIGALILGGLGIGTAYPGNNMAGQVRAPKSVGGTIQTATYLIFIRILGSTVGTIVSNVVYNVSFQYQMNTTIPKLADKEIINELNKYGIDTLATSTSILQELSPKSLRFVRGLIMASLKNVFYLSVGFAGVYLISTFFLTNMRIPLRSEIQERDLSKLDQPTTEAIEETRSLQDSDS